MAILNNALPKNLTEYPNSFKRQGSFPLEAYSVFYAITDEAGAVTTTALDAAKDYAKNNPIAYVGQHLTVVTIVTAATENTPAETKVDVYKIENEAGDLVPVGNTEEVEAAITALEAYIGTIPNGEDGNPLASSIIEYINKKTEGIATDTALGELQSAVDGLEETIGDANSGLVKSVADNTSAIGKLEDAGYQNASDVSTAITTALKDYYNKTSIDATVEELEGKISAIPKFSIEVVDATEDGTPNVGTPSITTVYLVPDNDTKTSDVYDEYIYVNDSWELLGKQTLDLTGYATETFVTNEIAKLSAEGGAIKEVADALDGLSETVGDTENGLVKDVADLKAINHDKLISDAIDTHNSVQSHLTTDDVDNQIDAKLTEADYEGKIATAKQEAIDEAAEAVPVKTVSDEFALTDGNLEVKKIAQEKVTGLTEAFESVNKSVSDLDAYVGDIPTDEKYADVTNVISYINKKAEETLASANGGSSETAASVAQALDTYKAENDPKVKKNTEDIATIFSKLNTVDEGAQVNKLEGVKVNGVALAITDKIVDIPAATAEKFGVVKLGEEFTTSADTGVLEVTSVNVNKLVQTDGDVLILDGGEASKLSV